MTTRGAFAIAVAMAAGIAAAELIHAHAAAAIAIGGCSIVLFGLAASIRRRRGLRVAAALIAAALLGAFAAGLRLESLRVAALTRGAATAADAVLTGTVLERPEEHNGTLRFAFGVSRAVIDGRAVVVRERVEVSIAPAPSHTPQASDRLIVDARLAPADPPRTATGAKAARLRTIAAQLRYAGIAARAFAHEGDLQRAGRDGNPIAAVARAGQGAVADASSALDQRSGGLLMGVTVGDTATLDPDDQQSFRTTGLSHLLAVSGGNLAMFLGAIVFLLRIVKAGRNARVAVLSVATLAFMAITRFEPSVIRAGAMTAIGIGALAAGAQRHSSHSLAVGAIGLMLWDPFLIHSIGFALSALATLGLLTLAPKLRKAFGDGKLAAAAAVSLGAQLAVGPLIALEFHQASLVALPANLLAVPAVAPATVLGFVAAVLDLVWRPAGRVAAMAAWPFLKWMQGVAATFARVPYASVQTPAGPAAILAVGGLFALIVVAARLKRFRVAPVIVAATCMLAFGTWARALAQPPAYGLRIETLDVGQGEAALVREPGGRTMLVDGGPDASLLLRKLGEHGVKRIDVLVLTHPHADHITGLIAAAARYPVGEEIDSDVTPSSETSPNYGAYLNVLKSKGIRRTIVRTGTRFAFGAATVTVLGPTSMFEGSGSDANNNSVVLRVDYGGSCALLSGEVQEEAQEVLLSTPDRLRCPIFKVPHHGSKHALREFYAATHARYGIIGVGPNNYGQPAIAPLAWMSGLGMRILRTDQNGDVTATITPQGRINVTSKR